jgi:hypothetical protein
VTSRTSEPLPNAYKSPQKDSSNMKAAGRLPYVIAGMKDLQLAVSAEYVQEIVRTPRWHMVPNVPRYIRGVINLRGKVLPLVDLRLRMGLPSALEDVEQMTREHEEGGGAACGSTFVHFVLKVTAPLTFSRPPQFRPTRARTRDG